MQSLFLPSSINSALPSAEGSSSQELFTRVWPEEAKRWPGFSSSLVIHVLAVLLVPWLSSHFSNETDRQVWLRQERLMRTLRIRIPQHLYVASTGRRPAEPKPQAVPRPAQAAAPAPPKPAARPTEGRRAAAPRRRFDLPPVQRRVASSQSLIQPQNPPDLVPTGDLRLPEVFFWNPPAAVRMPTKPFVQPGHAAPPSQIRQLDAPPKLELPTAVTSAQPQVATLLNRSLLAALTGSAPLRTSYPDLPQIRVGVSADALAGDPATLLAISSDPLPLREFMTAPPGNQIGRTPESGSPSGTGTGNAGQGGGTGSSGSGAGSSGRGAASTLPGGAGGAGFPSPASIARSAAVMATRIDHSVTGVFDVVVQSTGLENFAESAGVLSGKPIYSVFLTVGAAKEWILQYCLPLGEDQTASQVSTSVVRIGSSSALAAPYPKLTFRPPLYHRAGTHLMLHGFVSPAGKFQELRLLGRGDPRATAAVIAVLDNWEFRPATQDGRPVRVEILLAIPGE